MFSKEITTTAEDYRTLVKFTEYSLKKSNNILFIAMAVLAVASLVIGLAEIIPLYISAAVCLICVAVILTDILLISKKAKDGIKYGKVVLNASYDTASVRVFGGRTATDINAQWNTIFKIYEIENCFIIYFRYDLAFCLPKNQLTPQDIMNVRNYFTKKMDGRFIKKCK